MPDLNQTLEKYLRCVQPIISEESYATTERIVNEFSKVDGIGQYLQNILLKYAEEKENWVILIIFESIKQIIKPKISFVKYVSQSYGLKNQRNLKAGLSMY